MILVADASPVIFLAKLNRLNLVRDVFSGTVLMPESVRRELVHDNIPLHERERINAFLEDCRVEPVRAPRTGVAAALSLADRHVLALAGQHPRARIMTDDGVVRRVALAEGLSVTGTLGLIIRAAHGKIMTRPEARRAVDALVGEHSMRVSVDLYQEVMRQLG